MKKLKLRCWVKVALILILLVSIIMINDYVTKKDVDNCVSTGYTKNYCVYHLG